NGTFQSTDHVKLVRRKHQVSSGGNLAYWQENLIANLSSLGTFAFTGQVTGLGMGDFLTGRLTTFTQQAPNPLKLGGFYVGMYGQDTWKVTPRLTLTGGVRWEPYLPIRYTNGLIYNFNYDRFRQGIKSTVFKNAPAGLYYLGDP